MLTENFVFGSAIAFSSVFFQPGSLRVWVPTTTDSTLVAATRLTASWPSACRVREGESRQRSPPRGHARAAPDGQRGEENEDPRRTWTRALSESLPCPAERFEVQRGIRLFHQRTPGLRHPPQRMEPEVANQPN